MRAGSQVTELQRAEADALELQHAVADVVAHTLDLALAALVDRDLECVGLDPRHPRRRRHPVLEPDAAAQRLQRPLVHRRAADDGTVGLVDLEARVRQPVGEVAIVGQQDQAGRVGVQSADRIEPLSRVDERDDGPAPLWVAGGGDDTGRFVDRVDDELLRTRADRLSVELDTALLVDVASRVGDGLASRRSRGLRG